MSDEPEIKGKELSKDELKQVAGGKPVSPVVKPTPPPPNNTIGGGLKGESTDNDHRDWLEL